MADNVGVSYKRADKKWIVRIANPNADMAVKIGGKPVKDKRIWIGSYDTEEEGIHAKEEWLSKRLAEKELEDENALELIRAAIVIEMVEGSSLSPESRAKKLKRETAEEAEEGIHAKEEWLSKRLAEKELEDENALELIRAAIVIEMVEGSSLSPESRAKKLKRETAEEAEFFAGTYKKPRKDSEEDNKRDKPELGLDDKEPESDDRPEPGLDDKEPEPEPEADEKPEPGLDDKEPEPEPESDEKPEPGLDDKEPEPMPESDDKTP